MSQHDQNIANDTGAAVRADINLALAALFGNSSGLASPGTTIAYQWWADTTTGLLKIRNAANSAWVTVGTMATTNFGLAPTASPTFTGTASAAAANFTGQVLHEDTTARTVGGQTTQNVQVATATSAKRVTPFLYFANDNSGPNVVLGKSRGAALGTITYPTSGDTLGAYQFHGADEASGGFLTGLSLRATAGSTWSATNRESYLSILAAGSASTSAVEAARFIGVASGDRYFTLTASNGSDPILSTSAGDISIGTGVTGTAVATQAEMETGTATNRIVSPGRTKYHPGVAKAAVKWDASSATPTVQGTAYNVTSLTDNGVGDTTVNFTAAFSSVDYFVAGSGKVDDNSGNAQGPDLNIKRNTGAQATGSCRISTCNGAGAANDVKTATVIFLGDQ